MIFTTKGWLEPELVELRVSVTHEDDESRVERTDKHLKATGEWIGNDLNVVIKKGREFKVEQGSFV